MNKRNGVPQKELNYYLIYLEIWELGQNFRNFSDSLLVGLSPGPLRIPCFTPPPLENSECFNPNSNFDVVSVWQWFPKTATGSRFTNFKSLLSLSVPSTFW